MKKTIETYNQPKSFLDVFATMTKEEFLQKFPTKESQLLVFEFLTQDRMPSNKVKLLNFLEASSFYTSDNLDFLKEVESLRVFVREGKEKAIKSIETTRQARIDSEKALQEVIGE